MTESLSEHFDQSPATSGDSASGDLQDVSVPEISEKLADTDDEHPWDSHIFFPYAVEAIITPEPAVGSQVDDFDLSHDDPPVVPENYLPTFAPPLITSTDPHAITASLRKIPATQKLGKRRQANSRSVGGESTVDRTLPKAKRMLRHNLQLMKEFKERIEELNEKGLPPCAELPVWHKTRYSEAVDALEECSQDDAENARDKMDNTLHLLHEYLEWKLGASGDWSLRVEQWNTNPGAPQNALPRNTTMSPCFLRRKPPHPPPQLTFNLTPKLCFPTPSSFEPSPAQNTPIFLASLHPIATPLHSNVFNQSALTPVSAGSSNLRAQCHHTNYTNNSRRSSI